MNQVNFKKIYVIIALTSLFFAIILFYWDYTTPNSVYFKKYEAQVNQELQKTILNCEKKIQELSNSWNKKPFSVHQYFFLVLSYKPDYTLKYWSDNFFIPSNEIFRKKIKEPFVYQEKDKFFYVIPYYTKKEIFLGLIPLAVKYPIKNEHLRTYFFSSNLSSDLLEIHQVSRNKFQSGINYYGKQGEFLLSLRMLDAEPLRYEIKLTVVLLGFVSGVFFLLFWVIQYPIPFWQNELAFTIGIIIFRLFLIYFHLPYNYVQIPLFSSQILAINEWNPSLGDLTLNVVLLAFLTYRWYLWLINLPFKLKINNLLVIILHIIFALISYTLFFAFFSLFQLFIENSLVYFEFTDIFEIDANSSILLLNQSLALLILYFIFDALIFLSRNLINDINIKRKYLYLFFGYGIFIFACYFLLPLKNDFFDIYHLLTLIFFISLIYHLRLQDKSNYFSVFLLITALASIMNLALSKSFEKSTWANLEKITRTFSDPRDLVMEFTFNDFLENVKSDKSLLYIEKSDINTYEKVKYIINRLTTQHLIPNFKSYDFKIFVYDYNHNRLDDQLEQQPLVTERLEKTLSENLKFATNKRTFYEYVYLAKFYLFSEELGSLRFEIEFYPKTHFGQKLYPQLLLDENIKQKLKLPKGYEIGLYHKNVLINKIGNTVFPLYLTPDIVIQELKNQKKNWVYFHKISENRAIILKAPTRTFFSKLTSFTILFYIFSLIYLILSIPKFLKLLVQWNFSKLFNSLASRIQTYFLLISLLPIVIFSLLITPLFRNFFQTQIELELKENIKHLANHLEEKLFQNTITPSENFINHETLNYYSDLLDVDINVFDSHGKIMNSTLPRIFLTDIISERMNPFVYQNFQNGFQSEIIQKENVGNLEYLSAYVPLIDKNYKIVGFLNVPYLAKQDLLNAQIRQFLAYLINLYIVLILVTILFGLFTSSTITQPLKILSEKLRKLQLGSTNEPIEWSSKDEIGELIRTYNQMVKQLYESEQKLAKSEREGAWRTMARQVAHEIKNPLTPMKLSMQMLLKKVDASNPSYDLVQKIGKTILTQIDALTHIANSFSNFAKMPEGNKQPISLKNLLQEIAQLYQFVDEAEVIVSIPKEDIYIYADAEQITRVFINLIKNSLQAMNKYGKIEISCSIHENTVEILVKDNGVGIPENYQNKIFEPNFSTKTSGMGLGLAMCKTIIDAHDGKISFISKENEGTTFFIILPIYQHNLF